MAGVTIPCPECGKSHRAAGWEEAVAKCREGREKREAREAARKAEVERREAVARAEAPMKFVQRLVTEGVRWDSICKQLKDDYPPPEEGRAWVLYDVIRLDSDKLLATWPTDVDTITMLRLEKIMTGEYMTIHPLALPADGSFHMTVDGGRDLEPEINWALNVSALGTAERKRRAAEAKKAAA